MLIISHRVNTIEQLKKTPKKYGVEIDIKANGDKLVLTHEPHTIGDELKEFLEYYDHAFIILNIKETGIEQEVMDLAKKHNISDYFLLDVEYPFIFKSMNKLKLSKIAIRFSEYEPIEYVMTHAGKIDWVWVDVFTKLPLDKEKYDIMKKAGFKLCLVSPEQLGRPEDIPKYIKYCKQEGIEFDAVMCEHDVIHFYDD